MNHLKVHAGSRTMKGSLDKKFMCGQCDKKFFTRKDLKRHRQVVALHTIKQKSEDSSCCVRCSSVLSDAEAAICCTIRTNSSSHYWEITEKSGDTTATCQS
jgi:hypothetical protein